jgi:acyl carrier protein
MVNQQSLGKAEIASLVVSSLRDVLSQRNESSLDSVGESTYLIGRGSVLDSLGLVTLIVDVEQRLDQEYGVSLTLADDQAMSRRNSPFRSVQSMSDYIYSLIENEKLNDRT